MTLKIKVNGVWTDPIGLFTKQNGVYAAVVGAFTKVNGVYQSILNTGITLRQISTRSWFPGVSGGPTSSLFHSEHPVFEDTNQIQLFYAMFYSRLETPAAIGQKMALRIEYPVGSGTVFHMTFNGGATTYTTTGTEDISTDLMTLPFTLKAGTFYRIKGAWACTGSPTGSVLFCQGGSAPQFNAAHDLLQYGGSLTTTNVFTSLDEASTAWNTRVNSDPSSNYCILPCAIVGPGTIPAMFVAGDSRTAGGSADQANDATNLSMGAGARMIGNVYPYINAAQSSDSAVYWTTTTSATRRLAYLRFCTGTLNAMGTNDAPNYSAGNAQNLVALDTAMKTLMGTAIHPYMTMTLPPQDVDSNSRYDILANMSANVGYSAKAVLNAYRLAQVGNGGMYDHTFDQAPLAQDPSDSTKYRVDPRARQLAVSTTVGSSTVNVTSGTLTPADDFAQARVMGAGTSGANLDVIIRYVSATSFTMTKLAQYNFGPVVVNAATAVTGGVCWFGTRYSTSDGIHEQPRLGVSYQTIALSARL